MNVELIEMNVELIEMNVELIKMNAVLTTTRKLSKRKMFYQANKEINNSILCKITKKHLLK